MNDTIINSIELFEFGVFKKSSEGNFLEDDEDCRVGYYIRTKDIELVKQTETIYAMIGTVFGIKYKLNSKFKGATAFFDCKIIHPELIKPGSNKGFTETSEFKFNSVDDVNFDFFEFENSWELKAGKWAFQIIEDEKLLLNKEFTIEIVYPALHRTPNCWRL